MLAALLKSILNTLLSLSFVRKTSLCSLKCDSDKNCYDDEKCIRGECQSGCYFDDDCENGFKCLNGACSKKCSSNQNCENSQYCHIDHKVCHEKCSTDSDCSGGYTCFENECLLHCSLSKHCKYNQYCDRYFKYSFFWRSLREVKRLPSKISLPTCLCY